MQRVRVAERLLEVVTQAGLEPPILLRSDEKGENGEAGEGEGEDDHGGVIQPGVGVAGCSSDQISRVAWRALLR